MKLQERLLRWLDDLRRRESQLALVLSLVIGALVGLVVVAFILLTGRLAARLYPSGGLPWRRVLVPTIGSLLTGYLLFRYFPDARGSGVPQTKTALFIRDGQIFLRTVLGKFFCCSASLASGISLGREGPAVQIGAGLSSVIARRLGLSKEQVKALIPVGGAAALAAAFNTPIAAVLFSLEEIVGDLHAPVLGSVVLSSATSWMVLHLMLGDEPLFHVTPYHLVNPIEFVAYAGLGVVGGLGSVWFVKLLLFLRQRFLDLPHRTAWLHPVAGGLTVGIIGFFVPEVLGVGYSYVEKVLAGDLIFRTVVLLAGLKIIATAVCYASGNAGGIFGPSLFIGAMLGASVGRLAHFILPDYTAGPGAYALVGMGTVFAGVVRTPLTSVIMIFEVTRDYTIIVPLMISNLIAYFISHRLQRQPIYEALAHQDGIHLPGGELRAPARVRVIAAMRSPALTFSPKTTVGEARERGRQSGFDAWPIVDPEGFRAMIDRVELEAALTKWGADAPISQCLKESPSVHSGDATGIPHVHPDHSLTLALERMGAVRYTVLPVVSRSNIRQLLGVVTLDDILESFGLSQTSVSQRER